jgi:hypothetical protein
VALAVSVLGLGWSAEAAGAEAVQGYRPPDPVQAGGTETGGNVGVSSGSGHHSGAVKPTKPVYSSCTTLSTVWLQVAPGGGFGNDYTDAEIANATGWANCTLIAGGGAVDFLTRPALPNAQLLAAAAERELTLALPVVASSPPRGGVQLVGIPVWFWVENYEASATTATIPGLSATLTATPATTRVAISGGPPRARGDRTTLDCHGPGTPWVTGRYRPRASSDCSHLFEWNGTFAVDVTVDWNLTWTATNGEAGTLPTVSRTTTFALTIQEAQALTD